MANFQKMTIARPKLKIQSSGTLQIPSDHCRTCGGQRDTRRVTQKHGHRCIESITLEPSRPKIPVLKERDQSIVPPCMKMCSRPRNFYTTYGYQSKARTELTLLGPFWPMVFGHVYTFQVKNRPKSKSRLNQKGNQVITFWVSGSEFFSWNTQRT